MRKLFGISLGKKSQLTLYQYQLDAKTVPNYEV